MSGTRGRFRRFVKWHTDWSALWLWPLALILLVAGILIALVGGDYARGTFNIVLAVLLDSAATKNAEKAFKEES